MLPSCPELKSWQEFRYDKVIPDDDSISPIADICTDVHQYTGRGRALMIYIKEHELYGAWENPVFSAIDPSSKESLDQLIKNGAFKRIEVEDFNIKTSSVKFSIIDKRKLAVKFGYCLMDFFDADFASDRIHFFSSSEASLMEVAYLAFDSKFLIAAGSYDFQLGHPTFLSFAKLLIELELGGIIELEISPDSTKNLVAWARLVQFTDDLEKETKDSYREAITSCLLFHRMVDSSDSNSKDADTIRRIIYEHIVCKLECGLEESTPRFKRKRSESPPVPDPQDAVQTEDSWNMTTKPVDSQRATFRNKRQRGFEFQPRSFLDLTPRETYSSLKDGFPKLEVTTSLDRPSGRDDFEIALICALQIESDAVEALFDENFEENSSYGKAPGDPNAYAIGKMAGHNVVLAFMPGMGKVNSANVAASFRMSFPNIKLGIVVGICGGVPGGEDGEKEVLLGDIIVSTALIQYDFGRQYDDRVVRRDTLQDNLSRPNLAIRSFLSKYSGLRGRKTLREKTFSYLDDLCVKNGFEKSAYPGADKDILYHPKYRHKHRNAAVCSACSRCRKSSDKVCDSALELSCAELGCDDRMIIPRARIEKAKSTASSTVASRDEELREARKPFIHFGKMASGDLVIKSGRHRDKIAVREKVIAFEMEGAGVWDSFPTVVIKSVCDYADSHKNKTWQRYAAATAAACSKAFLEEWRRA
ncbi:uncharacterized protein TrAtP1_001421 [Trichoderma atroviride]|uniref:uncharacterized protein n=1 Tax=Hypocrea atroviridis TaxID=63577 RepID=UPI00331DC2C2|nr:hypothetical protein TrAtP1_001421 [Trichoderma atroviride]